MSKRKPPKSDRPRSGRSSWELAEQYRAALEATKDSDGYRHADQAIENLVQVTLKTPLPETEREQLMRSLWTDVRRRVQEEEGARKQKIFDQPELIHETPQIYWNLGENLRVPTKELTGPMLASRKSVLATEHARRVMAYSKEIFQLDEWMAAPLLKNDHTKTLGDLYPKSDLG